MYFFYISDDCLLVYLIVVSLSNCVPQQIFPLFWVGYYHTFVQHDSYQGIQKSSMGRYSFCNSTRVPRFKTKAVEEVKKKWNNLKTAAMKNIGAHRSSLTGTGNQ